MEKDKECVLNINIFNKYWKLLLLNYSKKDTQDLKTLYYASLNDLTNEEFIKMIKIAIRTCKYFPNVYELRECLKIPEWFDKEFKKDETSKEEQEELKKLLEIK